MKSPALWILASFLSLAACASPTDAQSRSSDAAPAGTGPHAESVRGSAPESGDGTALHVQVETYTLPNGLTVTLHEDHSLPKVVINTWFAVGSKDEEPGRTGFAHLFEHLMFMGTNRVPGNQFDVLMENGGGSNNASTSNDRTNYYSMGPSSLLPTLLWLDADRLDALADAMTAEKVDRQRDVVRNERRQNTENVPYGKEELLFPPAMYPPGHPYSHSVIGSHEDLEAATLEDVKAFFHRYYVPANASLVVAGDFDSDAVRTVIAETFGAIPARPAPQRLVAPRFGSPQAPHLDAEKHIVATDKVQFPKITLAWHSPAFFAAGDAEMDLIGSILTDGPSSRLVKRLVTESGLAQRVSASQRSRELGSEFHISAIASPGADLEAIRAAIREELDRFLADGPSEEELARVKVQRESDFLRGMESLFARADAINRYRAFFGVADGFQRDLDRWLEADAADLTDWARRVFRAPHVDLRILPEGAHIAETSLDTRPADFPTRRFRPPVPSHFELSNGIEVQVIETPGKHLFAGSLLVRGGESLFAADQAGLGALTARMLESGAGGLDQSAFAEATDSIGASLSASVAASSARIDVRGLTSQFGPTLDRFSDMALRPNLEEKDFEREQSLLESAIEARADNPSSVARLVTAKLVFGQEDPRGRPLSGGLDTVRALTLEDVARGAAALLSPEDATFVFVGDFGPGGVNALQNALEERFGSWHSTSSAPRPKLSARSEAGPRGIFLVDRPGAPQTVVSMVRPVASFDGTPRQARSCVNSVFGGSFTSRLNQNLREDKGYTYGVGSGIRESNGQALFVVGTAVRTDVTGASLVELRHEFEHMRADGISADELGKATRTLERRLVESGETTSGLAATITGLIQNGRPASDLVQSLAALANVTPDAVAKIASSDTFDFENMTIVLVGDRAAILPQLAEAGFPAPTELDAEGNAK